MEILTLKLILYAFGLFALALGLGIVLKIIFNHHFSRKKYQVHKGDSQINRLELLKELADKSGVSIYVKDSLGKYIFGNAQWLTSLERNLEQVLGKTDYDLFTKDEADLLRSNDIQVLQKHAPNEFEEVIKIKGDDHVFISHKFPVINPWDTSQAVAGISFDISERTKSLKLLNLKSFALEAAANGIVITDVQARILWVNPAFSKLTGYPSDEAIGQPTNILKSNITDPALFNELWETVLGGKVWHGILTNKRKDGSTYIEEQTITPLRDENGIISYFVAIKQDITDRVKAEEDLISAHEDLKDQYARVEALQALLREQAIRDPLTGLFNRRYLEETLKREIAQARRENVPTSIIMIDIDHFKSINDRYGHAAGDLLLQGLSEMLRSLTREGDVTCRFGGEEFVAILPGAPLAISYARAEEWRKEFELMRVSYSDSKIFGTLSAGVAVFPDHGNNIEQLLSAADHALYQAKTNGRNQTRIYSPG